MKWLALTFTILALSVPDRIHAQVIDTTLVVGGYEVRISLTLPDTVFITDTLLVPDTVCPPDTLVPPVTTDAVSITMVRLSGDLAEGAIPLPPGTLYPGEGDRVAVFYDGSELPSYTEILPGVHSDGSARAVMVQVDHPPGEWAEAEVHLQQKTAFKARESPYRRLHFQRGSARLAPGMEIQGAESGTTAKVFQRSLKHNDGSAWANGAQEGFLYLAEQDGAFGEESITILGSSARVAQVSGDSEPTALLHGREALLGVTDVEWLTAAYGLIPESEFSDVGKQVEAKWVEAVEAQRQQTWVDGPAGYNFYDRVLAELQKWAISGDGNWLLHSIATGLWWYDITGYRTQAAHYQMYEGMEGLYRAAACQECLDIILLSAEKYPGLQEPPEDYVGDYKYTQGRIMAKYSYSALVAWMVGHGFEGEPPKWLQAHLHFQSPDGSWTEAWNHLTTWTQAGLVYQGGMRTDYLSDSHGLFPYTAQERSQLIESVTSWCDFVWSQWVPETLSFHYAIDDHGHTNPANTAELNGLILDAFGFAYQQTGEAKYRERGNSILQGILGANWNRTKPVNQAIFGVRSFEARVR